MVIADADALNTALVNLLENALKYTTGDKRISGGRPRMAAGSSASTSPTTASGSLQANSGGSSGGSIASINGCRETAGVGLGLSIVELVMRAHGGSVAVRSAPGAGSTFTLRVPCVRHGQTA